MWLTSLTISITLAFSLLFGNQGVVATLPDSLSSYLAGHPILTKTSVASNSKQTLGPYSVNQIPSYAYKLARQLCPESCDASGNNPNNWTTYHDLNRLSYCNQTMLLDFAINNPIGSPDTHTSIRSCVSSFAYDANEVGLSTDGACMSKGNQTKVQESVQMAVTGSTSGVLSDFVAAAQQMSSYLALQNPSCNATIAFAYSGSTALGIFAGSGIQSQGISTSMLHGFIAQVENDGILETVLVQLCAGNGRSTKYSFGIIANSNGDLGSVQTAVQTWNSGECVTAYDSATIWQNITVSVPTLPTQFNTTWTNNTATQVQRGLAPRASADCTAIKVATGDTCTSLAAECGITPAEFTTYNPSTTLCSTLTAGEHVCCSAGTLPDFSPTPYANGTCATYIVVSGDDCSSIAASYSLTVAQLESFNNDTWGWMGCADLQLGAICLSTGSPPMPAVISNAVCGPQVPGTPVVPAGTNLTLLNQCPLNACCDIWGQCGTTAEFCTITESPTGAPGTAAEGTNGCISNCGTEIIVGEAPASYMNVAYFEGFNTDRPCLNMPITAMDLTPYTHVHLAFATITPEFALDVSSIQDQFDLFLGLTGDFKKIISIGGWAFSTDPSTYMIYREAVQEANQATFVDNIVSFLNEYNLDGVDFDWEYPGEPDIPGIPPGSIYDGVYYSLFLDLLAAKIPDGKTMSFCAPASFWYLQYFLVQAMSDFIDYIVFMTYDLHGQWDYGNLFSDPGCPLGDCLRSDVNLTETINALSMITKAGVPTNKIVVGVTSYGRSFGMTTAGCYTEECTFVGLSSGAYAGPCTLTPGYIGDAEIGGIVAENGTVLSTDGDNVDITGSVLTYLDSNSYSNIVVYDDTQWIGYMDDDNKAVRKELYSVYNFAGTADWAIDLQSYVGDNSNNTNGAGIVYVDPSIWTGSNQGIPCEPPCIIVLPPYPLGFTETITWPTLTTTLLSSSAGSTYTVTTTMSVPDFTVTEIDLQPITLSATDTGSYILNPVQSVTPSSFIWTLPPNEATFPPTPIPTDWVDGAVPSSGTKAATSSQSIVVGILPSVTFYTTPFPITIQPQPTYSISFPPLSKPIPPVTITKGPPNTECKTGCGNRNCGIFGCWPGCGFFGCDGGCSIFGCGGGCGPFGCIGDCFLDICGGINCLDGGCGYTENGEGGDDQDEDCDEPSTVSACTIIISSFSTSPMTEYSTTTKTFCSTAVECSGENKVTTTTETGSDSYSVGATETLWDLVETSMPVADYESLAASISSMRFAWDSSRFSGMTLPPSASATTTPPPTTTTPPATTIDITDLPYPSATELPSSGDAAGLCYSSVTDSVDFVEFSYADYEATVEAFCSEDYTIGAGAPPPGNDVAYQPPGANYNVIADIDWTNDQTGCGTESQWTLTGDLCTKAWYADFNGCGGSTTTGSYGGGYIYNTGYGCLLINIYAVAT